MLMEIRLKTVQNFLMDIMVIHYLLPHPHPAHFLPLFKYMLLFDSIAISPPGSLILPVTLKSTMKWEMK